MHYKLKFWHNGGDGGRNQVGIDEDNRLAVEYKRFLEGVWRSHGLPVPSDEEIEKMAIEGLTRRY
jgi:hypothetical protein